MKITAEIFDFEKFDYASQPDGVGWEYLNTSGSWQPASGARAAPPITSVRASLYRRPKPPPVFMLLNPGERLQDGDQQLVSLPARWGEPLANVPVEAPFTPFTLDGEVWCRPAVDLRRENQRLQREIESLEREVVELQLKIKNRDKSGEE